MGRDARTWLVTFEEFCFLIKEWQKADLIEGVIYVTAPESIAENQMLMWFISLMGGYVEERGLGRILVSRVAFRLDETNGPEPDLAFVRTEHLNRVQRNYVNGSPDLALEIVSPGSIDRDYEKKRKQYERFGVPEYWIVDEIQQKVTLLRLSGEEYREVRLRKGELASKVLKGFWLRPEWLWQEPRPIKMDLLTQILARRGA